ncbi:MAG: insulinase family protein [Spirochaetes bacterium]|nr:insulinase family protein [Spirochaetota bacterium]
MKKILTKKSLLVFLLLALFVSKNLFAEIPAVGAGYDVPAAERTQLFKSLDDVIPTDPSILIVQLDNKFTYYIKENRRPENRIILRLVVNAGSILEDDNQRGLAHMLEHMAFRGTTNFPGNSIANVLEREGIQFGPDLNAYVTFDRTVYMLDIPADREDLLDTALLIMFDWASGILNEIEEMETERLVVIEEWRRSRGARQRIGEIQREYIFSGSRYAERAPIGTLEVLENFERQDLVSFFEDWYRPDLMALIIVGDVDKNIVDGKVRELFSQLYLPENRRERPEFPVPARTSDIVSIVTDPEAVSAEIRLLYLLDNPGQSTVRDYRNSIISSLYISMLNSRYRERAQGSNPPFASASAGMGRLVRTKSGFMLTCIADPRDITGGFTALVEEFVRLKQHGFTESEFERAKESHIRFFRNLYLEAANTHSGTLASEYTRHFLEGEFVPGIKKEYYLTMALIHGIALDEINALSDYFVRDRGVTILISAPEGSEVSDTEADRNMILEIFHAVFAEKLEPFVDDIYDGDLVANMPSPGKAVLVDSDDERGIFYYRLSNGARLVIKQTDFRNDQVLFSAFSRGGTSLASDDEWVSANFASAVVSGGRLGNLTRVQLDKYLKGKVLSVSPTISNTAEGFSGSSSIKDLETLFQLVYLYFTGIEKDKNAFDSYISRLSIRLRNQERSPRVVFSRRYSEILADGNFRGLRFDSSSVEKIDLDKAYAFFRKRFSNPGDFTFIFTGAAGPDIIVPLAEKYLAFLPANARLCPRCGRIITTAERENMWRDNGLRYPKGNITERIYMGKEERVTIAVVFKGDFEWSRENVLLLRALTETAHIRLRNVIREDEGGTYSINVYPVITRIPFPQYQIVVFFEASLERAEELKELALNEIAALSHEIPEGILMKFQNSSILGFQRQLRENSFWLSVIRDSEFHNTCLGWLDEHIAMIESITEEDIMRAAALYFNMESVISLMMFPEASAE